MLAESATPGPALPRNVALVDATWALGGALLWTVMLLLTPPAVFGGPDFIRYFEPYLTFLRASILQGEMPWWNPYASLGRPFAADLQTGTFYPTNYLSVVFGLKWGWILATVPHGVLAMLGFIRLTAWCGANRAASRVGALVFLFSAPLLARMQVGTINYAYSWCYLPLGLWLAGQLALAPTRRTWAALALVWALQLLSSHPQPLWLSIVGAGAFVTGLLLQPPWAQAWRRWWRAVFSLATALLCGMALCGFVLVPFLELVGQSNRAVPNLSYSASFAMTPAHWMSLMTAPSSAFAVNWEYNIYVGVGVILGGIVTLVRWREPVVRGLIAMIIIGTVIALGGNTPLFGILFKFLPGLSSFRVPGRAGVLVMFGVLLAATVLAGRSSSAPSREFRRLLAGVLLLAAVTVFFYLRWMPGSAGAARWLGVQLGLILLAGTGWWWLNPGRTENSIPWRQWLLPGVIALELYLGIPDAMWAGVDTREFPAEAIVTEAIRARKLDATPAPVRVNLPPELLRENSGMIHGYATITGFESLSLTRVWRYLHLASGVDPAYGFNSNPAGEVYEHAGRLGSVNLSIWLPPGGSSLRITPTTDPRAYVATRVSTLSSGEAITRMNLGHPFHEDALVETPPAGDFPPDAPARSIPAVITRFTRNSLDVAVDTPVAGMLVVAEAWYPGWQASINGQLVACVPVNAWMRGVVVPAGRTDVHLSYRPNGLALGVGISLISLLVLLWATWWPRNNSARNLMPEAARASR